MDIFFYNWTTKPFTHNWDGKPYTFEPGKVYRDFLQSNDGKTRIFLEMGIASHFAKHLAHHHFNEHDIDPTNKEFARNIKTGDHATFLDPRNPTLFESYVKRALTLPGEQPAPTVSEVPKTEPAAVGVEAPKKRMGRPPKVKEEFVGVS